MTPTVAGRDRYNAPTYTPGTPVEVRGVVQPVQADELQALGAAQTETVYRFIGRGPWPGGVHSTVTWDGREWDQLGEAKVYSTGRRTGHIDVLLRARTSEVR
ncbi:hypothetical protein [Thalassiella azotivora]